MASYADNRDALFGTSKKDAPKPKPQKKSYTLGGQSKAAQQRQRERQQQLKQRGDDFYAAAEALMPPKKTGFTALMDIVRHLEAVPGMAPLLCLHY